MFCLVHVKDTVHGAFIVTMSPHLTRKAALTFDFIGSSHSNESLCEVPVVIATVRVPEPLCVIISVIYMHESIVHRNQMPLSLAKLCQTEDWLQAQEGDTG